MYRVITNDVSDSYQ